MTIQELSVEESIKRILITPLVTRVYKPSYGSALFELIDKPITDEWILDAIRYTYEAIELNEVRVLLKKVSVSTGETVTINIDYIVDSVEKTLAISFSEVENVTT